MPKPKYIIFDTSPNNAKVLILANRGFISSYSHNGKIIVARYGVNKTTLKKILKDQSRYRVITNISET